VYAVEIKLDNEVFHGMLSIGSNPTVNQNPKFKSVEVHILNFDKDIYGKKISVIFRKRLRDEKKFDDLKQLSDQMEQDKQDTLQFFI